MTRSTAFPITDKSKAYPSLERGPKTRTNYFEITISGFTNHLERITSLHGNLDVEIAMFEHCWVSEPKIIEVKVPEGLFEGEE